MNKIYERYFFIKHKIQEEEFRYWDATRNSCSLAAIERIERNIRELKAELELLKQLKSVRASYSNA